MEGGQAAVSVCPSGTFGRASLWRLSQSSPPHKCRSHLGFSLGYPHRPVVVSPFAPLLDRTRLTSSLPVTGLAPMASASLRFVSDTSRCSFSVRRTRFVSLRPCPSARTAGPRWCSPRLSHTLPLCRHSTLRCSSQRFLFLEATINGFASAGITRATASVPGRLIARSCHASSEMGSPSILFTCTRSDNFTTTTFQWRLVPAVRQGDGSISTWSGRGREGRGASCRSATSASSPTASCQICLRLLMFHEMILNRAGSPSSGWVFLWRRVPGGLGLPIHPGDGCHCPGRSNRRRRRRNGLTVSSPRGCC